MSKQIKVPWKNGYYYNKSYTGLLTKVEGNLAYSYITGMKVEFPDAKPICDIGTWKYGDFGPANQEVQKASGGVKNYNVELDLWAGVLHYFGVIAEDGETLFLWGISNALETMKYLTPEGMKQLSESREPIEALSCPYEIRPENQGKLVWLSGPPGAGKSTTGQLMGRHAGWRYYEADCSMYGLNPFVPLSFDNPTLGAFQQPVLKGYPREYYEDLLIGFREFEKLATGNIDNVNWEICKPFYGNMAKDVGFHKKQIGGNFVVAQAVTSRNIRDHIRRFIPDCVFVTMSLTPENQRKRVTERHGEGCEEVLEILSKMHAAYEGPGGGEKNTYNVDITVGMTKKDVMNKLLEVLEQNCG